MQTSENQDSSAPRWSTRSCTGQSWSGLGLNGINLQGVELRDAELNDTDLRNAELHGTDLCQVGLHGANLYRAQLHDTKLSHAELYGADLSGADLRNINLADVDGKIPDETIWDHIAGNIRRGLKKAGYSEDKIAARLDVIQRNGALEPGFVLPSSPPADNCVLAGNAPQYAGWKWSEKCEQELQNTTT